MHPDVRAEIRQPFALRLAFNLAVLYMSLHPFEKYVRGTIPSSRAYLLQVCVLQVFTDTFACGVVPTSVSYR